MHPMKVDVHHHIIPPQHGNSKYTSFMPSKPEWTIESDRAFSKSIGVSTSILSVSVPGALHISDPRESAAAARAMNEDSAALRDQDPLSYGFFATVPSLEHVELALAEIRYAFDHLQADGVTLFTRYGSGDGYLGHPSYIPIWEELNARKAVVFVHPINNKSGESFHKDVPPPAFDWPHETGRTAIDLILHGRMQQFPDVKIILSHAGGTLSALVGRIGLIAQPEFGAVMSAEDIYRDAKKFYFDTALSGSPEVLPLILGFAEKGHILFGSDFPHATVPFSRQHAKFIDEYEMSEEMRQEIYCEAAKKLFPRLVRD